MTCIAQGCKAAATHTPVLLVRHMKGARPVRAEARGIALCESCTKKVTVDDLIPDDLAWHRICGPIKPFYPRPVRELTEVEWQRIAVL